MSRMSVPYALIKQVHPQTTVEHCLYCNFYSLAEKNLVVAGPSYIKVFRLSPDDSGKIRLECLQTFNLFGNLMSIQSIYLPNDSRDALLISFREAKLALVEYDPTCHDLKVLSLHHFEDDENLKGGITINHQIPLVRVDPDGRCAVALIYGKNLVVLPFRSDMPVEETEGGGAPKSLQLTSYTIKAHDVEEKLDNIIDLQFLHGYYEPTLLILYEPIKTWPGRIAVRQDTCCIVALSLNIFQKVHPIIWSQGSMPFDCLQVVAVPKPLCGVLILATNSLLYLNQSVPPYGISLSSFTDYSTNFPLKGQTEVKISLDCAQACFIAFDKLVLSLKSGDIYVVTMINDGMRSVRNFIFHKAASSVLTTCMVVCDMGHLFLGSRLGNSILLHYTQKEDQAPAKPPVEQRTEERPAKRPRLELAGEWMASDVQTITDPEELEVYGRESQGTKEVVLYNFEVCDTLMNIAPCAKICMGEPAFLSEEFSNSREFDLELVTTSGYSKNGALSILQRSIRPQVVTTFELPGIEMFTVIRPPAKVAKHTGQEAAAEEEEEENPEGGATEEVLQRESSDHHAFLLLSRETTTMILQTRQEINELDHSGFNTQDPTIYAANLGGNNFILQVSPMGARLLKGSKQLQHIPLDVGSPIVWASVADPYAVLLSEDGMIIQLTLKMDASGTSARLALTRPQLSVSKSRVLTLCLYKDVSGMFVTTIQSPAAPLKNNTMPTMAMPHLPQKLKMEDSKQSDDIDEVDALLYGEAGQNDKETSLSEELPNSNHVQSSNSKEVNPTYWLFVARENGLLEIYSLPDFKLRYLIRNFPFGQKLLVDSTQVTAQDKIPEGLSLPVVKEILVVGLGPRNSRPLIFARLDEDVVIYEAFPFVEEQIERHLKLRFKKVYTEMIFRNWKNVKGPKLEPDELELPVRLRWLRYFDDVSSHQGVFICGRYPHWVFMTARGELRIHPMEVDKPVVSFAPFHNINCPNGFLYFTSRGELRICVLPTHLSYDALGLVMENITKIVKSSGEEKEYEELERDERYIFPQKERFSLQLFSPVNWEPIPNTRIELEEWRGSGMKGYLALGTNYCSGEDVTNRGRIIILDIIEVVPEPNMPLTKNKMKIIYDKEQKGPVTELCQVAGFLLSAIGQKIYIWQLRDNDLVGIAFIDTQIYIHHVISVKNLILIADIQKSISLLRFQESSRTLSLVARDFGKKQVYTTQFFMDNLLLGFALTDSEQNFMVYTYNPESRESMGGVRLIRKCDFNMGNHINSMFRIKCNSQELEVWDKSVAQQAERRQIIYGVSLDGSLHYILPISEKVFRRLHMLQNLLTLTQNHTAGLNPKSYRLYHQFQRSLSNSAKNTLDGDLLFQFLHLSVPEKAELAKKSATSPEQIVEDLLEVTRCTAHF
ncbi:CPSF1 [Cordylochernes scorpioides]|uniref:CPSF1 n=1 Tax=Cordylochernes scorpioides TaxID=51811 RepID=A0ABY6LNE6_9ARAC|nr:CPSF1 [Cordylochernes scorpioides]